MTIRNYNVEEKIFMSFFRLLDKKGWNGWFYDYMKIVKNYKKEKTQ